MANVDLTNCQKWRNLQNQKKFGQYFWLFTLICTLLGLWAVYYFLSSDNYYRSLAKIILGLALMIESYAAAKRYAQASITNSTNLADKFSDELLELMELALAKAAHEGQALLTSEYLFENLSLARTGKLLFLRLNLPYAQENPKKTNFSHTQLAPELVQVINQTLQNKGVINLTDLIINLVNQTPTIKQYLSDSGINEKDLGLVLEWLKKLTDDTGKAKWWEDSAVTAGVGQEWSYGYTPVLSLYSYDLSRYYNDPSLEINIFSHTNKLNDIQTTLARSGKNNVLLVGEPGVGKKTLVNALALKLARGDCQPNLKYKRIRQLDIGRMLAGADQGELEARLSGSFTDAVAAGNIILYIDNFQSLLGSNDSGQTAGNIDATQVLLPYLQNSNLRIIASLSPDDYFERARANSALVGAFEKIDVEPASTDDTKAILLESAGYVEGKYKVIFPFQTLKKIVELSDRYLHEVPFPEKALRLMEEAGVTFASNKYNLVTPQDIEQIITNKTRIPVGQVQEKEKDKLLNLEHYLHERVVGQDEAINVVADTLRRVRAGITTGKRPSGVFLFLGPTGVGKTETAKALAEIYFSSEKNMIRLDMSEYQQPNSIDRLIGSTTNPSGVLTDAILANPFTLILLDEIEKADKNILNVFLQVFEDGRLTDARGKVLDFTNTIIIATSNAGSQFIREQVNAGVVDFKDQLIDKLQKEGIFSPEFINRFDSVVNFNPLTEDQIKQVAKLMINQLNKTLTSKKVQVGVDPDALAKLAQLGYDPEFGARPMRRVIQQKVENLLAKKILSGEVGENQTLVISINDV